MLKLDVLSVRDMDIMSMCPLESQQARTIPSNDIDDSKIVEDVHVPPKTASIIEGISVDSGTSITDEAHVSSDGTSDNVNEIVEYNIPTLPSRLFEFPYADYGFMVVPAGLSTSESSEVLVMIQQMISDSLLLLVA